MGSEENWMAKDDMKERDVFTNLRRNGCIRKIRGFS